MDRTLEVRCPRCGHFVLEGVFESLRVVHKCGAVFFVRDTEGVAVVQYEPAGLRSPRALR